jgi:hypothetical protein
MVPAAVCMGGCCCKDNTGPPADGLATHQGAPSVCVLVCLRHSCKQHAPYSMGYPSVWTLPFPTTLRGLVRNLSQQDGS